MKYYANYEEYKKDYPNATFSQYMDHKLSGYVGK